MNSNESLFELQLDAPVTDHLLETAKWAKFLAIVGFVFCGLILLLGLFGGAIVAASLGGGSDAAATQGSLLFGYGLFAIVYFFPCLYLFHFSRKIQDALRSNDQIALTSAFKNLKRCYKFVGILTIILIALWVAMILFAIVAAGR